MKNSNSTALACIPADTQATDADTAKCLNSMVGITNLRLLKASNNKLRAQITGLCLDQIRRNWA